LSKVAVPPPGGSGTTARSKLESIKVQRYNRSRERYNRWEEQKHEGKIGGTLSLTTEEDKGGVRKVYVN